ncbi:MAG: hypothetical protein HPY81_09530 [Firmicutes bacterium]|nr:hypothetical protein [Bacillota bacterium]
MRAQSTGLADSAVAARSIYENFRNDPLILLRESAVYRHVVRLGLEADFNCCLQQDQFAEVPYVAENGIITKF